METCIESHVTIEFRLFGRIFIPLVLTLRLFLLKGATTSKSNVGAAVTSANGGVKNKPTSSTTNASSEEEELPEELQHLDKELVKKIQNEIMESGETVTFEDIAGLDDAKQTVQEVVCWPMKRPDLFTGLRRAPNGLLLYGPPGKSSQISSFSLLRPRG